ncbi:hypothetical protein ACFYSF_32355 [Streptomyces canus]|uniref:hypothetical protein n=1 Tax=Streptomyces canus TaxID=58343 RepID=UPI0036AE97A7
MTITDITHSRAEAAESAEAVGPSTRSRETLMISELVMATLHLEHLAETADPPKDETAAHLNGLTTEQQRSFVAIGYLTDALTLTGSEQRDRLARARTHLRYANETTR